MSDSDIMSINSPSVSLAVTAASANVLLPNTSSLIRVVNLGAAPAYLATGGSTITAAVGTNLCIPAGAVEVFAKQNNDRYLAAISSGTTNLSISCVEGV